MWDGGVRVRQGDEIGAISLTLPISKLPRGSLHAGSANQRRRRRRHPHRRFQREVGQWGQAIVFRGWPWQRSWIAATSEDATWKVLA
jgi:hypothetical protein